MHKLAYLLLLWASAGLGQASTPTATPTPANPIREADCVTLSDTSANLIGTMAQRQDISFVAYAGPIWCNHVKGTPTPNKTPGGGWAAYAQGSGLSICEFADQPLWCFGLGGTVCYDEARISNQ